MSKVKKALSTNPDDPVNTYPREFEVDVDNCAKSSRLLDELQKLGISSDRLKLISLEQMGVDNIRIITLMLLRE